MRNWLSTREVAARLGVSRRRVAQLHAEGKLAATPDTNGADQFDREEVERYVAEKKALVLDTQESRDALRAEHAAARERSWHERLKEQRLKREREEKHDALLERIAASLERIAKC